MKKIELLAPAGSYQALVAAVQNGCDAVYLGGKHFGARAYATNFNNEEMIEAIQYCHLYDVKVYVTINTIIYENELNDVLNYINFLYQNDVDAVIVQDIGLLFSIRQRFPELEIHASTQMHIHNQVGLKWAQENGIKRVVLARETPLKKISNWMNESVETEVFVHGALCVCYSGQCNMSSSLGNRSANRGECAQPCRLPYSLIKENNIIRTTGNYLLSTKDLCTVEQIGELIETGITSIKIEGRMKKPVYVGQVVSMYRKAIDYYYIAKEFSDLEEYLYDSKKLFNRTFTSGYLFNASQIVQQYRPNHQGVVIGKVKEYYNGKILVSLSDSLVQGDGIRIFTENTADYGFQVERIYRNQLLVREGHFGEEIELDSAVKIEKGSIVVKTADSQLEKKLEETQKKKTRRVPIEIKAFIEENKPIRLIISDNNQNSSVVFSEETIECAINQPTSKERIEEQLLKLNNTVFSCRNIAVEMSDNLFVSIKVINDLRRRATEKLEEVRKKHYPQRQVIEINNKNEYHSTGPDYLIHVETEEQLKACKEIGIKELVLSRELNSFAKNSFIASGVVNEDGYYPNTNNLFAEELGALNKKTGKLIIGSSIPVVNKESIHFLTKFKPSGIVLSNEISLNDITSIIQDLDKENCRINLYQQVYGYKILMHTKHCPIRYNCQTNRNCGLCNQNKYYLENEKKQRFKLKRSNDDVLQILDQTPIKIKTSIKQLKPYLHFTIENYTEVIQILKEYSF